MTDVVNQGKNMFQRAQENPSSMMGLDINCFAITLLEISAQAGKLSVENYARELFSNSELPPSKQNKAIAESLQKLMLKNSFKSNQVIVALPDSSVITKIVEVGNNLSSDSLEEMLLINAEYYFPSEEKIHFDFEILGPSPTDPSLVEVLLVASKAEHLKAKTQLVEDSGLIAKVVEVESFALERAALLCLDTLNQPQMLIGFINLGIASCQLMIFHEKQLIFSKEEPYGEIQLLEAIAAHYQMSLSKAGNLLLSGFIPEGYEELLLNPFKNQLLIHIKRILEFFYINHPNSTLYHVFVGGNVVKLLKLDLFLKLQLDLNCSFANPLASMFFNEDLSKELVYKDAQAAMLACGLALRNLS